MTIRALACALLFGLASAHAAPAKKTPPAAPPPEEIDVDAMARAKDAGARAVESTEPAATDAPAAEAAAAVPPDEAAPPPAAKSKDTAPPAESPDKSKEALALTPPIDPQEKRLGTACEARSTSLLDAAQKGDFAAATKDFDARMRSAMPPEKFKETWASLAQFGALQARGQAHPSKGEGYFIVMTPLIFEHTNLIAQIACGSDGRIAGFHVKPLSVLQK